MAVVVHWILVLGLASCSSYAPSKREVKLQKLPGSYSLYGEHTGRISDKWWEEFNSPGLNRLVERGIQNNLDIRRAIARIKQSRAALEKVGGAAVPTVSAGVGRSQRHQKGLDPVNEHTLDLTASYELDVWGRVEALVETEKINYRATRADLESVAMSLAADIVLSWLDIIAVRQEIAIVRSQIESNSAILELLELRFENAMVNVLDVLQQIDVLAAATSNIPRLEAKEQILLNNLSLLLGESTVEKQLVTQRSLPDVPPLPDTGIPADLLANRPDIRSAGLALKSSDWNIAAARANRLPSVSLTGSYRYSSNTLSTLLDNWIVSLGATLASTLYDGGTKAAEVKRQQAIAEEKLAEYKSKVYGAVIEVENSIVNEKKQAEFVDLVGQQLKTARQVLAEAERQYSNGLQTYLPVITQIPKVQLLEKQVVTEKLQLLKYRVALCRSMGGSWTSRLWELETD